jgi:hypothetical protein
MTTELGARLAQWAPILWGLAGASLLLALLTMVAVPFWLVRLPADYFAGEKRRRAEWARRHPLERWILLILRGAAGAILVLVGLALLVLPGQGLLTILSGLMVASYPGKYRLERWLVRRPGVHAAIDWLRRRAGRAPLLLEPEDPSPRAEDSPPC